MTDTIEHHDACPKNNKLTLVCANCGAWCYTEQTADSENSEKSEGTQNNSPALRAYWQLKELAATLHELEHGEAWRQDVRKMLSNMFDWLTPEERDGLDNTRPDWTRADAHAPQAAVVGFNDRRKPVTPTMTPNAQPASQRILDAREPDDLGLDPEDIKFLQLAISYYCNEMHKAKFAMENLTVLPLALRRRNVIELEEYRKRAPRLQTLLAAELSRYAQVQRLREVLAILLTESEDLHGRLPGGGQQIAREELGLPFLGDKS